jgi:dipeptidyl-peptidase 4
MKIKISLSIIMLFLFGAIFSQEKELSLEDAVRQQYRAFYPEHLFGFSWIPGTNEYTYLEKGVELMKASTSNTKAKLVLTIENVNNSLGSKLNWFSGFEWIDGHTFMINDGINYYSYSLESNSGKLVYSINEEAANQEQSPDKNWVAFTIDNNLYFQGKNQKITAITEIQDKNIVSGQTYARSEFGITDGIFWSPKNDKIAFAQKDETHVHDYPLLDISQTPGALNSIKYPMAGQKSEQSKIGIYDLKTKKTVFIKPRSHVEDYLTNVSWTPDGQFILIAELNRGQNHMWLNKYNATTGAFIKTLFEETSDRWVEPEHPAFFPSESSNSFVWISEKDGFNNLYYYDIDGKLIKKLTSNIYVTKEVLGAINKGKEIVFAATGDNPMNTLYFAVDLKGRQRLLTRYEGTHSIQINSEGTWMFDAYSNHVTPSISQLVNLKNLKSEVLLIGKNKLKEYRIGTAEISTLKAKDSTILYTRLIKPSDFDSTKVYPVLVYVYGGPHAQLITNEWLDGASLWMYWMAEQGYLVYTLDNRGSGERGVAFESGIHRQLGTLEMEDQLVGVEYLKSLPYVDGERLAVHGWSFGGFMTTSLMLRQPGTFQVGVAGGPVTDWKYYEIMYGERYMDMPDENPEGYKTASLLNYADKLEGDLLLIHGTVDDVVVMQHNFALIQKFVEEGIQMDFFPYPMHPHNVGGKDRVHLMTKVLNYVIEHNK